MRMMHPLIHEGMQELEAEVQDTKQAMLQLVTEKESAMDKWVCM